MSRQVAFPLGVVDRRDSRPAYRQIADQIGLLIEDGTIAFDQKLPSETALLEHYEVARMTVRQALAELRSLGYVRSVQGRGVFANMRAVDYSEAALPGIHLGQGGGVYVVQTMALDRADVYRLMAPTEAGEVAFDPIGELRDLPDDGEARPHYSWREVDTEQWHGHELGVRDWREATDRLIAATAHL